MRSRYLNSLSWWSCKVLPSKTDNPSSPTEWALEKRLFTALTNHGSIAARLHFNNASPAEKWPACPAKMLENCYYPVTRFNSKHCRSAGISSMSIFNFLATSNFTTLIISSFKYFFSLFGLEGVMLIDFRVEFSRQWNCLANAFDIQVCSQR